MYCSGCGETLDDGASFCRVCGRKVHSEPSAGNTRYGISNESAYLAFHKSEGIAILLGLLITGGGQMYAGRIGRGIAMFLFSIFSWVLLLIPFLVLNSSFGGGIILLAVVGVFLFIFVIWTLYDAYNLVRQYNNEILRTGRPPW
jgi:TM2 domain.